MSHHPHVYLTVYPCTEHLNPPPFLTLQPLYPLLFVYTALLIGELLSFFCVWTLGKLRCHALLHLHKKTH